MSKKIANMTPNKGRRGAKGAKVRPRKRPTQDRAAATVEVLLEAARRVLIKDGYELFSTNRIAKAAGCSIGSLYQYFPSKEALIAELIERHTVQMTAICRATLIKLVDAPLATAARETCAAMVAAHAVNPKLSKIFREQLPRVGQLKRLSDVHAETAVMVAELLRARAAEVRVADPQLAAFFIVHGVDALIHATLDLRTKGLSDKALVDELTRFVLGYLQRRD